METNQAAENLQTIRTLMERSAVYRRALAPIMVAVGTLGWVAAIVGVALHCHALLEFEALWIGTALIAIAVAFLIVRRQAIKDHEPFWSPPTRRVAQAMAPPLLAGLMVSLWVAADATAEATISNRWDLLFMWLLLYGCALLAAGFFAPKVVKWLGWFYLAIPPLLTGFLLYLIPRLTGSFFAPDFHWLMGFCFGLPHLTCGIYLYFTESRKTVA